MYKVALELSKDDVITVDLDELRDNAYVFSVDRHERIIYSAIIVGILYGMRIGSEHEQYVPKWCLL